MLLRNQYVVGVVSGVLICMIMIELFQFNTSPQITGYYQTSLNDVVQVQRGATTLHGDLAQKDSSTHDDNQVKPAKATDTSAVQTTTTQKPEPTTTVKAEMMCKPVVPASPSERRPPPLPTVKGLLPLISENHQDDDNSIFNMLYRKVKVLCWILTSPGGLNEKAIHSYNTWGRRCNKVLFFSSTENSSFPAPVIKVDTEEGRDHLTAKTMHAFKYIFDHYYNDYDWFMKADDDTFVIVENLRYFLSDRNPMEPVYYGHHFKAIVEPQGYYGGGGGYVLSKNALYRFGTQGFHNHTICREDHGAEDAEFGKCMQSLGVKTAESHDEKGRSRFHGLDPGLHLSGTYPYWYYNIDSHGAKHGADTISDYPISFHYMTPKAMYEYMFYVYHLRVYGITDRSQPILHSYYSTTKLR